ncbi:MAG: arylamine N-acetyltransferase [Pseudomonadota bacterium]
MTDFQFDAAKYLARIKYAGSVDVSLDSLKSLQLAQLRSIPFENFDICLGNGIDLVPHVLSDKLIENQRGGYCFELNGLMLMALQHFGFKARALLGRVHITGTATGRGHQVCLVRLGSEDWIVDTGFGSGTPQQPIPLIANQEIDVMGKPTRLLEDEQFGYMLQTYTDGAWNNQYSFDLNHVCAGDIAYGNHYTSTNADSIFTYARVATLRTESGLVTLLNHTLTTTNGEHVSIEQLPEGQAYLNALKEHFGIVLGQPYERLKPLG